MLNIVRVEGVTRGYFLNGGTKLEKIALIYPKTFVHRYRRLVGTIAQLNNTKSGRGRGGGRLGRNGNNTPSYFIPVCDRT